LIAHRVDAKGKKMARYKPISRDGIFLPVILAEQIQPGTFEFALDHLVGHELDLSDLPGFFGPVIPVKMALRQRGAHEEESIQ
jgi:hypothetical protein